jgi:PKD repeat protein
MTMNSNPSTPGTYRIPGLFTQILLVLLVVLSTIVEGSQPAFASPAAVQQVTRFAIITDMGTCSTAQGVVAAMVSSWDPEFLVTAGDNWQGRALTDPNNCSGGGYPAAIGNYYSPFLSPGSEAFWPSPGNHDYYAGINNYQAYFNYLPNNPNGNKRYYHIIRGPVHFFLLDSEGALNSSSDMNSQKAWLELRLRASAAPWKIVVLHHPPYTGGHQHQPSTPMRWPFAQWGADFVVAGHNHIYERSLQEGIRYFTAGVAGGTVRTGSWFEGREAYVGGASGAMRVHASELSITFEYITSEGTIRDTYNQTKEVTPPPTITTMGSLVPFTSLPGQPSAEQSYSVAAANLTGNLEITAPQHFRISTSSGSGFGSTITLTSTAGSIANTPIYVRFQRSTAGSSGGNISHTSPGADTVYVAVSGTAANQPPNGINLSSNKVPENQPAGTLVGNFSSSDPDNGDTFTYSLVSGSGDTGNSSFNVSGSQLLTSQAFDFETQSSYSIRVRTTDQGGLWFEQPFTITIVDVNESPVGISLSNNTIEERQPAGTLVGSFSTSDPDRGDTFIYSLVSGTGDTGNIYFIIEDNQLLAVESFDLDIQSSYSIRVRTSDQGGLWFERAFTITVIEMQVPPQAGFSAPGLVYAGEEVAFTNISSGTGPLDYLWDFGGTLTSTLKDPTHVFPAAGAYSVSLTASNQYGSDSATLLVQVERSRYVDLMVEVASSSQSGVVGASHPFYVLVANLGTADATGVILRAALRTSQTTACVEICTAVDDNYSWEFGTIESGQSKTLEIELRVLSYGAFDVVFEASSDQEDDDPDKSLLQFNFLVLPVQLFFPWVVGR